MTAVAERPASGGSGSPAPSFRTNPDRSRAIVAAAVFVALFALALVANPEVPTWFAVHLQEWAHDVYMWTVRNNTTNWVFTAIFNPIARGIDGLVHFVHGTFTFLRWPGVVALTAAVGWRTGGVRAAIGGGLAMFFVGVLGVWDPAMVTLSIMLTSVLIALIIGIPLGIWSARSDRGERILRGMLDTAQVMPAFVYLLPITMLFGLKYPPAVVATVVCAIPPAVRLTNLGLRSVPVVSNEVAQSFGSTSWQQLVKVQLPMARRTILLGLNQVIMMAFGIVVIAALLGADDLGQAVLKGLQKNDVGAAFVPGMAIVLLAISLDRITTGEKTATRRGSTPINMRTGMLIGVGVVAVATAAAHVFGADTFPDALVYDLRPHINDAVAWVNGHIRKGIPVIGGTEAINRFLVVDVLEPLRSFLVWLPWLVVVVGVALIGYMSRGWRLAGTCAACLLAIGAMGTVAGGTSGRTQLWDLAMDTLSQVLVAIVISVLIAIPLGIAAGRSDRFAKVLRPFLDVAQVMPQFVYLIPVLFLFGVGRGAGVVASVIYAIPPCIRLTSLGMHEVPFTPREAAISFGATPSQELRKVQLPLAFRSIMLGINQTILMVLATVIIAALIGAGALGLIAYESFAKPIQKFGPGVAGGLSIVFLAIVLDRLTQAWGTDPNQSRRSQ